MPKEILKPKQLNNLLPIAILLSVIITCGTAIYIKHTDETKEKEKITKIETRLRTQKFIGTLPCPDCPGITTELTLQKDINDQSEGRYTLTQTYEGINRQPITFSGRWELDRLNSDDDDDDDDRIVITLEPDNSDQLQYWYVVNNETIELLDKSQNRTYPRFNQRLKRIQQ